ncbi:caspase family protein [Phormidium tenue FACHB-886]|nr:caspase family protein [Phormidium tenue FACHB-886]
MTNYWAITIGINQYQHLQPLAYAERDAQAVRDFLTKEAGVSPRHCLLLTDSSPAIEHTATYPSREIIQAYITQLCQKRLQPGDFLWCFFSGCGVRSNGKDYLIPTDGKPDEIDRTGIPVEWLFNTFAASPTQNILLLLDVNRSQSVLAGEGIGDQTLLLAQEQGIPTILSSQPDQFSHETLALRQGLFTTALLEAMRHHGSVTLESLVQYLNDRLPELSDHHWRPQQTPCAVVPTDKKHQLIVPDTAKMSGAVGVSSTMGNMQTPAVVGFDSPPNATALLERSLSTAYGNAFPFASNPEKPPVDGGLGDGDIGNNTKIPTVAPLPEQPQVEQTIADPFWRRLMVWGGAIAAVLLLAVLLRNWQKLTGQPTAPASSNNAISVQPGASNPTNGNLAAIDPLSPLGAAQAAVQAGSYEEAQRLLEQLPAEQRTADYVPLLEKANQGILSQARTVLSRSREASSENQASDFADAIAQARQIKQGQPLFEEAHIDMDRWSRVILDMAQGRAERPNDSSTPVAAQNYSAAISTAQLVPNDNPQIYAQTQQAIAQWSQLILDLANDRAKEGNYELAVQAAALVPPNTAAYTAAQAAIAQWNGQAQ